MAERRKPGIATLALWGLGGVGVLLLVLFAVLLGPWLFTKNTERLTPDQRLKAQNDVRTTLVQALGGLAVAGGLVVTYRTYRQTKVEQERSYQQRLAEEKRRQAEQDRTHERELYSQAVEQLGHEQAPVRLGALHSLESLGQDQPQRRQTVVDVLCAYLRMPYTPQGDTGPGAEPAAPHETPALPPPAAHDPAQELQVRQTAQRILARHLRRPADTSGLDAQRRPPSPEETFWPGIRLDLTGAALVELNLEEVSVIAATFNGATFTGPARFAGATFAAAAWFAGATFAGDAMFVGATFAVDASFAGATFTGAAWFAGATFDGPAWFNGATFTGAARFMGATFTGPASFAGVTVLHLDDSSLDEGRLWPRGWTVRPDPADPSRGTLHKLGIGEGSEQPTAPPA
jgi:hypothetical protein